MPRIRRKERADYAPDYVPEEEYDTTDPIESSDSDITPTTDHKTDPSANIDETEESTIYVSRSTYDRPVIEKPPEPVPEHPIQKHGHLETDDLVDDDPEMGLGAELADIYQSRSTYVLTPTPPKEPKPTKHRRRTIEDFGPGDEGLIADADKQGGIYDSESTYDIGEMGSVIHETADKLIAQSKITAKETKIVSHSDPFMESDAVDMSDKPIEDQMGDIYESKSTYEVEKSLEGTGEYLTGVSLSGGVAFIRGATSVINPVAWVEGMHDLTYLASSRYAQKQFAESVAKDPFRFMVDTGAAIAGGYLAGKLIYGGVARKWQEKKLAQFYDEFPEEAFYAEDGIPDPSFPHPTDVERLVAIDKTKVRIVDDLGSGFLDAHQYPTGGSWPKSGRTGFGKVSGYRRTGHDLIPELIPEGIGRLQDVYRFGLEYGTAYLPGVTGLPPYFEAALGKSSLSGYLSGIGGATGLITSITPDIDKPLGIEKLENIQELTPIIDDTGLSEVPKIIEMSDETFKPKSVPKPPKIIPRPPKIIEDPWVEPGYEPPPTIEDIIQEQDTITTTDIIQDLKQEPKEEPLPITIPTPVFPIYIHQPPRPSHKIKPSKKSLRKSRKLKPLELIGYETKKYDVPDLDKLYGEKTRKRSPFNLKGMPKLDNSNKRTRKTRRKKKK